LQAKEWEGIGDDSVYPKMIKAEEQKMPWFPSAHFTRHLGEGDMSRHMGNWDHHQTAKERRY
jgi:hypothetical protein